MLPGAKFTLHPSLAFFYIGSVTAGHASSERQPNCAASYKNGITELSLVVIFKRGPPIFLYAHIVFATEIHCDITADFDTTQHTCYR